MRVVIKPCNVAICTVDAIACIIIPNKNTLFCWLQHECLHHVRSAGAGYHQLLLCFRISGSRRMSREVPRGTHPVTMQSDACFMSSGSPVVSVLPFNVLHVPSCCSWTNCAGKGEVLPSWAVLHSETSGWRQTGNIQKAKPLSDGISAGFVIQERLGLAY